jgi:glycosyltransferase involved in cell wall biosynthesis
VPRVSVIIPTYNRSQFITEAVDSALAQTYTDREVVVVDDGSTDDTRRVLEPYRDRIVYQYQENAGVSAARNTGIQMAGGEWIALLDSDDEWRPEKLAVQMQAVDREPSIVAHMVNVDLTDYGSAHGCSFEHCRFPMTDREGVIPEPFIPHFTYRTLAWPSAMLYRKRAALGAGLYDEAFTFSEEYDFDCRLALQGAWGYCWDKLVAAHRRQETGASLQSMREDLVVALRARMRTHEKLLELSGLNRWEREKVVQLVSVDYRAYARKRFLAGKTVEAKTFLSRACRLNPCGKNMAYWLMARLPSPVAKCFFRAMDDQSPAAHAGASREAQDR